MEKRFGLDALRALAIGSVVFTNIGFVFFRGKVEWFERAAPDGVDLFFVLSGFLISLSLLRHLEGGGSYWHFWLKRAVRTIPPFFAALTLYGTLLAIVPNDQPGLSILSFLFLQNLAWPVVGGFSESWSLSVGEWYYASFILLAAAVPVARPKKLLIAASVLLAVSICYRATMAVHMTRDITVFQGTVHYAVLSRLDGPAMGVFAAYSYWRFPSLWRSNRVTVACTIVGMLGTWGLVNVGISLLDFRSWELLYPPFFYAEPTLVTFSWALLLVPAMRLSTPIEPINAVTRQVARSAYSIYLTHYSIVMWLLVPLFEHGRLLAFLLLTLILSQVFYFLIERPALRARHLFDK